MKISFRVNETTSAAYNSRLDLHSKGYLRLTRELSKRVVGKWSVKCLCVVGMWLTKSMAWPVSQNNLFAITIIQVVHWLWYQYHEKLGHTLKSANPIRSLSKVCSHYNHEVLQHTCLSNVCTIVSEWIMCTTHCMFYLLLLSRGSLQKSRICSHGHVEAIK